MKIDPIKRLNFLIIVFSLLLIAAKWSSLPPELPLFYSRPWGQEQLAKKFFIFILPLASLTIFFLNSILAKYLFKKNEDFLFKACFSSSLVFSLLCTISLIKIIFLIS